MGSMVKSGDGILRPWMNVYTGHIYRVYASNQGKYSILVSSSLGVGQGQKNEFLSAVPFEMQILLKY